MSPQQHPTEASPGTYRIEYWRGLSIRLHSVPAATGIAPEIVARRCTPEQASYFPTLEAAMAAADRFLPGEALAFVRGPA
jgi:hypothetical protein